MAIRLIYCMIVIPVSTVLFKFEHGWDKWCALNKDDRLGPSWDDGHLFARASMDPSAIEAIARKWEKMGFVGEVMINGERNWIDFYAEEPVGRCAWISYCVDSPAIYLSDTIPGEILSPKPLVVSETPERYGVTTEFALILTILSGLFILFFR